MEGAVEVLSALAGAEGITVAVVSGREMVDLIALLGPVAGVVLVAEHGAVWSDSAEPEPVELEAVRIGLQTIAASYPGAWVEIKTVSLGLHSREVAPEIEPVLVAEAESFLAGFATARPVLGKKVLDVGFTAASKGYAIEAIRQRVAAAAVIFAGDDTTDETVFVTLRSGDIGIKVGDGDTAAGYRVASPADVVALLTRLLPDLPVGGGSPPVPFSP